MWGDLPVDAVPMSEICQRDHAGTYGRPPPVAEREETPCLRRSYKEGLDPEDFAWEDRASPDGDQVSQISHRQTGFYCAFIVSNDVYNPGGGLLVSPGPQYPHQRVDTYDFPGQIARVYDWLVQLKQELQPDRWSYYDDVAELRRLAEESTSNEKFTSDESQRVL